MMESERTTKNREFSFTRHRPPKKKPGANWPPVELCLPNMDELERLSNGGQPEAEPTPLSDTETRARCLLPLLAIKGVATADTLPPRSRVLSDKKTPGGARGTAGSSNSLYLFDNTTPDKVTSI